MDRDYDLAERLGRLSDDTALDASGGRGSTGYAVISIQQRKIRGLPAPIPGPRALRWRLGAIRDWIRSCSQPCSNKKASRGSQAI